MPAINKVHRVVVAADVLCRSLNHSKERTQPNDALLDFIAVEWRRAALHSPAPIVLSVIAARSCGGHPGLLHPRHDLGIARLLQPTPPRGPLGTPPAPFTELEWVRQIIDGSDKSSESQQQSYPLAHFVPVVLSALDRGAAASA